MNSSERLFQQRRDRTRNGSVLLKAALALLCFVSMFCGVANAAVLGIDMGTEWFTIALANPGRPLDLVLNRDSKRQTASVVTVNGLERTFGADSVAISSRIPEKTYFSVRNLLGVSYDSDAAAQYRKHFSNRMVREATQNTVAFQNGPNANDTILTVQEIVAMELAHAKQLVRESEGILVNDVVLTVPSFFSQAQRQAMLDAAALSGLRPLAIINDGSAVALNYAMSREFPTPEKHLFYDMGAGKTVATVATFLSRPTTKYSKNKKTTIVNVHAYASDNSLGGQELDFIMRDLLADRFMSEYPDEGNIRDDSRAMSKLLKEAKRAKTILSANVEVSSSVEGLYKGIDFRTMVTREELESAAESIVPRIRKPIDDALRSANVTLEELDSIVLVGGGSRVPLVQRTLSESFGTEKLSKNVNADEASVMGAVFKAATLSSQFRVRDIKLRDPMQIAIRSTFSGEKATMFGDAKKETNYIYPEFSAVGARRIIRSTRSSDFDILFESKASGSDDQWTKLATAKITGVADAVSKLKAQNPISEKPEVKVSVIANEFGMLEVTKAVATFNITNPKYKTYLEDLAAWSIESSAAEVEESASASQSTATEDGEDNTAASAAETKTKAKLRSKPSPQPEQIAEVISLDVEVEYYDILKLDQDAFDASKGLLKRMDADDKARIAKHNAANELETLVYRLRDMVEEDEIAVYMSTSEREKIESTASSISEWLEDEGDDASLDQLQEKITELKVLEEPIVYRRSQNEKRPKHVKALKAIISQAENITATFRSDFSEEELEPVVKLLEDLEDTLDSTASWLDQMITDQDAAQLYDDPVLTTDEMDKKALQIERSLTKLVAEQSAKLVKRKPSSDAPVDANGDEAQDGKEEDGDEPNDIPDQNKDAYGDQAQDTAADDAGHDEL